MLGPKQLPTIIIIIVFFCTFGLDYYDNNTKFYQGFDVPIFLTVINVSLGTIASISIVNDIYNYFKMKDTKDHSKIDSVGLYILTVLLTLLIWWSIIALKANNMLSLWIIFTGPIILIIALFMRHIFKKARYNKDYKKIKRNILVIAVITLIVCFIPSILDWNRVRMIKKQKKEAVSSTHFLNRLSHYYTIVN